MVCSVKIAYKLSVSVTCENSTHQWGVWSIYAQRLNNYFLAKDISDTYRKRAILLNALNEEAYKLMYDLAAPKAPAEIKYEDLMKLMNIHFKIIVPAFAARQEFYNARKKSEETRLSGRHVFMVWPLNAIFSLIIWSGFCETVL